MPPKPPSPESAVLPATSEGQPRRRILLSIAASLIGVCAAVAASAGLLQLLVSIETSPEEYQRWGATLRWSAFSACIFVAGAGVLNWDHPVSAFRRSCRFAAITGGLSMLLAFGPVPGGYLAGLCLMIAAARFAAAALSPLGDLLRTPSSPFTTKLAVASSALAFLCTAAAMFAMKFNELGWANAID